MVQNKEQLQREIDNLIRSLKRSQEHLPETRTLIEQLVKLGDVARRGCRPGTKRSRGA